MTSCVTSMNKSRPPSLNSMVVCSLLKKLYPFKEVEESSVRQLPGYEDRNVYFKGQLELRGANGSTSTTGSDLASEMACEEFIFKVSHLSNSYELLEGIGEVMERLKHKGFHCSFPILNRYGKKIALLSENQLLRGDPDVRTGRDAQYPVRVLVYLPGETLETIQMTPKLAYDIGELAGRIDRALLDFSHPVLENRVFSCPMWDLRHFSQIKTLTSSGMSAHQKSIVETTVSNFEEFVRPHLSSFSQGVVHNDITVQNIVWKGDDKNCSTFGIIDFGDCMKNCHLFELGTAIHGFLSRRSDLELDRALHATAPLVAGYNHAFPLSGEELGCLYYVVLARMCVAAVATELNFRADPQNSYLGDIVRQSWRAAEVVFNYPKEDLDRLWMDAVKKDIM